MLKKIIYKILYFLGIIRYITIKKVIYKEITYKIIEYIKQLILLIFSFNKLLNPLNKIFLRFL